MVPYPGEYCSDGNQNSRLCYQYSRERRFARFQFANWTPTQNKSQATSPTQEGHHAKSCCQAPVRPPHTGSPTARGISSRAPTRNETLKTININALLPFNCIWICARTGTPTSSAGHSDITRQLPDCDPEMPIFTTTKRLFRKIQRTR